MGHTVYPMRWIVYDKIYSLRKLCKGLREPEKSVAESLLIHLFQNISSISYANPLPNEIENNMIFMMLMQEKFKKDIDILDLTLLVFSIIISYKTKKIKTPDEEKSTILQPKCLGF